MKTFDFRKCFIQKEISKKVLNDLEMQNIFILK